METTKAVAGMALGLLALGAVACAGDEGTYSLTWEIRLNGAPSTCAAVGADGVEVLATPAGSTEGISDIFDCNDLAGETAPLPVGDYTVIISLLAGNSAILSSNPITDKSIDLNGEVVDLGDVLFDVSQ